MENLWKTSIRISSSIGDEDVSLLFAVQFHIGKWTFNGYYTVNQSHLFGLLIINRDEPFFFSIPFRVSFIALKRSPCSRARIGHKWREHRGGSFSIVSSHFDRQTNSALPSTLRQNLHMLNLAPEYRGKFHSSMQLSTVFRILVFSIFFQR